MKAIVAMDPNRVIGCEGKIPWHYTEDMKWFKEFTMGRTLVMGWNTYQSLPVKLKGRKICVLSREWTPSLAFSHEPKADDVYFRYPPTRKDPSVMDVFDPTEWSDAIVTGGAKTYILLLPHITEMYVTHIAKDYEGDTYMPEFENQFSHIETIRESNDFSIIKYTRGV